MTFSKHFCLKWDYFYENVQKWRLQNKTSFICVMILIYNSALHRCFSLLPNVTTCFLMSCCRISPSLVNANTSFPFYRSHFIPLLNVGKVVRRSTTSLLKRIIIIFVSRILEHSSLLDRLQENLQICGFSIIIVIIFISRMLDHSSLLEKL